MSLRTSFPLHSTACKALADELEYEIKKIGPRRTVNSGTFRINPDGTRGKKKVRQTGDQAQ